METVELAYFYGWDITSENIIDDVFFKDLKLLLGMTQDGDNIGLQLSLKPINSAKEWYCDASFIITGKINREDKSTELVHHTFSKSSSWKLDKFVTRDKTYPVFKTIKAQIKINSSYIGQPLAMEKQPMKLVIFERSLNDFLTDDIVSTSHKEDGFTWIVEGRKTGNGVEFRMYETCRTNRDGYYSRQCIITIGSSSSGLDSLFRASAMKKARFGGGTSFIEFDNNEIPVNNNCSGDMIPVVTFVIDRGIRRTVAKYDRTDFGADYLEIPAQSGISRDGTTIPLNSYILSRNSPVLKNLIEKEGELDHDVTDFEPETVRLFIDACYSGTLESPDLFSYSSTENRPVMKELFKMFAVFQVEWALEELYFTLYRRWGMQPCTVTKIEKYWDIAVLALDGYIKHDNRIFLEHFLLQPFETFCRQMFHIYLSKLITKITKRSEMDLLMVLVVQFDFITDFHQQLCSMLLMEQQIPLLGYILENFNLALYEQRSYEALILALKPTRFSYYRDITSGRYLGKALSPVPNDGTLATMARNHWCKIEDSTWPCFNSKRPFSVKRWDYKKHFDTNHPSFVQE
eukprot:sb/3463424/